MNKVTVAIPTVAPRAARLAKALSSVSAQTSPPGAIAIAYDGLHQGAAANRDRALAMVDTEFVAFLDDDDQMKPEHLRALRQHLDDTGADLVYPWFEVVGGTDPFPQFEHAPWDDQAPHQVPVTFLARTGAIRDAGGFSYAWDISQCSDPGVDADGHRMGEDYRLILRLVKAGATISHLDQRSWLWFHHESNSSGLASRIAW